MVKCHWGLSPRVRGNRAPCSSGRNIAGSIPARAGEPSASVSSRMVSGVYPRACGGTTTIELPARPGEGLSPRVRGNPRSCPTARRPNGSIPARAGEPFHWHSCLTDDGVYPRACGGTCAPVVSAMQSWGLSPRVRGNLCARSLCHAVMGSIPARAGNRSIFFAEQIGGGSIPARAGEPRSYAAALVCWWVYPRACGGTRTIRAGLL